MQAFPINNELCQQMREFDIFTSIYGTSLDKINIALSDEPTVGYCHNVCYCLLLSTRCSFRHNQDRYLSVHSNISVIRIQYNAGSQKTDRGRFTCMEKIYECKHVFACLR